MVCSSTDGIDDHHAVMGNDVEYVCSGNGLVFYRELSVTGSWNKYSGFANMDGY